MLLSQKENHLPPAILITSIGIFSKILSNSQDSHYFLIALFHKHFRLCPIEMSFELAASFYLISPMLIMTEPITMSVRNSSIIHK